jgi:hypothetical protein
MPKLSRYAQMLYELGSRRELARREEVWSKWEEEQRKHAMFPSTMDGDRGCVSPLGTGVAKPASETKG